MDDLINDLRKEVHDLPLTFLVHGCGTESHKKFLSTLLRSLRGTDAVWQVSIEDPDDSEASINPRGVLLDLSRSKDIRIYNNLIADVVFFAAEDVSDSDRVAEWERQTRTVVVDGLGAHSDGVLKRSCVCGIRTYRWDSNARLQKWDA